MKELQQHYQELFNEALPPLYFSPGRVNLIGEHLDYNGGHVFPCAISLGIYGYFRLRDDRQIRLQSLSGKEWQEIMDSLDTLTTRTKGNWGDYPLGVVATLQKHGYPINTGFDVFIQGNLPNGAGLSSSAALEMLIMAMLNDAFKLNIPTVEQAQLCQEAENQYVGVACGIMDQFAVAMGKAQQAIYLDANTLQYQYAPLDLGSNKLVIINTGKRRSLTNSAYNQRRQESEEALKIVQQKFPVHNLCELNSSQLQECRPLFSDMMLYRRARHCVTENERTAQAYQALQSGNMVEFGRLMFHSHDSLCRDYQVSCYELNALVNLARKNHAKGARMTGAGFGGCMIVLIKNSRLHDFLKDVTEKYPLQTGYTPSIYLVDVVAGTGKVAE